MEKLRLRLKSVDQIMAIPLVGTAYFQAFEVYYRVKTSNRLFEWGFGTLEGGVNTALDKSLALASYFDTPIDMVDNLVSQGIRQVEERVPVITYPTEVLKDMTKGYVTNNLIKPVLKRADSMKQLSLQEASKYGELAASRFDNVLDVADKYVDKYLPDATDKVDSNGEQVDGSRTAQAIKHANRFSRKVQRRLTLRTLAEAKALKKQSLDTMECLLYLGELMIRDPKQFVEKMKTVWVNLSQDEPENQVPPANLEQLIAMLTREGARRFVHFTNFWTSMLTKVPTLGFQMVLSALHQMNHTFDFILKPVNQSKELVISKSLEKLNQVYTLYSEAIVLVMSFLDAVTSEAHTQQKSHKTQHFTIEGSTLEKDHHFSPHFTTQGNKLEKDHFFSLGSADLTELIGGLSPSTLNSTYSFENKPTEISEDSSSSNVFKDVGEYISDESFSESEKDCAT